MTRSDVTLGLEYFCLRLSVYDVRSDHSQVVGSGFKRDLSVTMGNKACVIIKGHVAFPPQAIKNNQQASMLLADPRPHELDDRDVVPRLTSGTESMAEHEPEGSLKHRFVGLLQGSLLVESEDFVGRGELLLGAREKAFDLRPVDGVRL
jgi:hypothetical protein